MISQIVSLLGTDQQPNEYAALLKPEGRKIDFDVKKKHTIASRAHALLSSVSTSENALSAKIVK